MDQFLAIGALLAYPTTLSNIIIRNKYNSYELDTPKEADFLVMKGSLVDSQISSCCLFLNACEAKCEGSLLVDSFAG
jgi:hypothetical protein